VLMRNMHPILISGIRESRLPDPSAPDERG